jgi:hypothetical protein
MRQELPRAMYNVQAVAAEIRAQQKEHTTSAAEQRLAFLEDRAKWINDQLWNSPKPVPSLVTRLAEVDAELETLREQVAEEKTAAETDASLAAMCEVLLESPFEAFDALPWQQQHRVYHLLFAGVRIETEGEGFHRRWRLRQYRALIGDQLRVLSDAPWCRREHPHTSGLRFEPSEVELREATYATRHTLAVTQLRELASALSGVGC